MEIDEELIEIPERIYDEVIGSLIWDDDSLFWKKAETIPFNIFGKDFQAEVILTGPYGEDAICFERSNYQRSIYQNLMRNKDQLVAEMQSHLFQFFKDQVAPNVRWEALFGKKPEFMAPEELAPFLEDMTFYLEYQESQYIMSYCVFWDKWDDQGFAAGFNADHVIKVGAHSVFT